MPPIQSLRLRVDRVLANSDQTLDIITVEEVTGQRQLKYLVEPGAFDTDEGRSLMEERPHLTDLSLEQMRAYPRRHARA